MNRTRIWIPEAPFINLKRYVEVDRVDHGVGIEGWFTVELIHARTGLVKRRLRFRNVITNAGLNALAGGTVLDSLVQYLAVGAGSNPPAVTDTALQAEVSPRTSSNGGFADVNSSNGSGDSLVYWSRVRTRVFTESQANGNLAELGFFNQATGGTLWNRQLFLDELGQPTVITKTNEDQLRVQYEYRVYPPMADLEQDITVNSTATHIVNRVAQADDFGFWGSSSGGALNTLGSLTSITSAMQATNTSIVARGGSISGASASTVTPQSYTVDTFYREREGRWEPSVANFQQGVVSLISYANFFSGSIAGPAFQVSFNPAIMKNNTQRLIVRERWIYNRVTI